MANKSLNPKLLSLAKALISGNKTPMEQVSTAFPKAAPIMSDDGASFTGQFDFSALKPEEALSAQNIFNKATAAQDISEGVSLGQLGQLGVGAAMQHPFKTAGLIGSAAGNLGGLTDNDKLGGQLGGLALGGLAASQLAAGNPYMAAMMTMSGGNLGSLFDKLRARKEQEKSQGYSNAGNPIAMLGRL